MGYSQRGNILGANDVDQQNERAEDVLELLLSVGERVSRIEATLLELRETMTRRNIIKDWYSTSEVAEILGKKQYTVREWCRLGRIKAEKTLSGRGIDEEWRISRAELERYRNEGLLPVPTRY